MELLRFVILVMALVFLTGAASADTVQVNIKDFQFQPADVTIKNGDTVTWTNLDTAPHDVKFKDDESPNLNKGESYSKAFDQAGTFDYICDIHPYMKGRVIVR